MSPHELNIQRLNLIRVTSWGPRNYESIRSWIPNGDANLQRAWLRDYLRAVEWMRQKGVPMSERFSPIMTIGEWTSYEHSLLTNKKCRNWLSHQNPVSPRLTPEAHRKQQYRLTSTFKHTGGEVTSRMA